MSIIKAIQCYFVGHDFVLKKELVVHSGGEYGWEEFVSCARCRKVFYE